MRTTYHPVSIVWHWLIAALVIAAFALSFLFEDLPNSPQKLQYISWHKWAGIGVLFFTAGRILTRLAFPPPPLPAHVLAAMPKWQHLVHRFTLAGMLLLTIALPLVGWAMSSAKGYPVVWLGAVPLPDLVGKDQALAHTLKEAHELLAWALAALVVLHLLASLKHHFVDKDGVLARVAPWLR